MSPAEFKKEMFELATLGDEESAHQKADYIMCDILEELGYLEGIEIFKNMERWYA